MHGSQNLGQGEIALSESTSFMERCLLTAGEELLRTLFFASPRMSGVRRRQPIEQLACGAFLRYFLKENRRLLFWFVVWFEEEGAHATSSHYLATPSPPNHDRTAPCRNGHNLAPGRFSAAGRAGAVTRTTAPEAPGRLVQGPGGPPPPRRRISVGRQTHLP